MPNHLRYAEAAAMLGITVNALKQRVWRGTIKRADREHWLDARTPTIDRAEIDRAVEREKEGKGEK